MPKVREVIRRLHREGWYLDRTGPGDHQQWKHPDMPERLVTIDGQPGDDMPKGTYASVQRNAGWK